MTERNPKIMAQLELIGDIMRTDENAKLYDVARVVFDLGKIASSLHKRYENACNYEWACTEKYLRRTESLEQKARDLGASIGLTVGHQRDPRGWPMIVRIGMIEHGLA